MSAKQDRQGVRTARDLEQKYAFGQSFSEVQKSIKVATNTAEQAEKQALKAQSEVLQLSDSIKLEVDNGETTAQIKLKVGDREIPATIDMKGLVTFSNLEIADGTTVINGSNITTGQILADLIKAGTIKSKDGEKIVIDLDNGKVHVVGTFETEWQVPTSGGTTTPVHSAMNPNGLFVQNGEGTDALRSAFSFYQAYVQNHNTDFTKAEAYMRPYGDPYEPGKSMMGLKHGDVASVEHQVVETLIGTAFAQTEYKRGSRTLVMGVNDARTFISGLDAPQYNKDAVNKAYVDGNFAPSNPSTSQTLDHVGWYRVGVIYAFSSFRLSVNSVVDTVFDNGAIVDIVAPFHNPVLSKISAQSIPGSYVVDQVRLVKWASVNWKYYVDIHYVCSSSNPVYIHIIGAHDRYEQYKSFTEIYDDNIGGNVSATISISE